MGFQMPMNKEPVTDPSTISDADMPFDFQAMPDVTPQATSVPEQLVVATPEPLQQAPVAPVEQLQILLYQMLIACYNKCKVSNRGTGGWNIAPSSI